MKKTIVLLAIGTFFLLAANPSPPQANNMEEIERAHTERVEAARQAYEGAVSKADDARLVELQTLLNRTTPDQIASIQQRIDQLKKTTVVHHRFFRVRDTGKKVVYLCDASGSFPRCKHRGLSELR